MNGKGKEPRALVAPGEERKAPPLVFVSYSHKMPAGSAGYS